MTLLSTKELAALFKVTETTIKRWADSDLITCVKSPGGHRKFKLQDVVEFGHQYGYPVVGIVPPPLTGKQSESLDFSIQTANYNKISKIFLEEALEVDKRGLNEILQYLIKHRIAFSTISDEVIRPAMVKIGELWASGKLEIDNEHLASEAVTESIIQLAPELHRKPLNGKTAVCACAEGEYHEIGLRIISYALECEGWKVHYIGANTPFDTLHSFIKTMKPDLICLSYTLQKQKKGFIEQIQALGKLTHLMNAVFVVGGFYAGNHSTKDFNCDHIATSVGDVIAFLKDRFQLRPGPKKRKS